jgi:4-carboxymuconolactone decarboxylase
MRTNPQRRLGPLDHETMSAAQRAVADEILAGPRGSQTSRVGGPFEALLCSPGLASRVQRVGEYVRFESSIPPDLTEMAVLLTARRWSAQFEWFVHAKLARSAGLDESIVDAIARGDRPVGLDERSAAVYGFTTELLDVGSVSDDVFQLVSTHFGAEGVVDLIGTVGYYCMISFVLNVDRFPVPDGSQPLKPLPRSAGERG